MKKLLCLLCLLLPLTALGESWEVREAPPTSPESLQTIILTRSDAMHGGLLLVNQWHARPEDFDESAMQPLYTYARSSGLGSFWDDSSCKLHPIAQDALLEMFQAAADKGYNHYVIKKGYCFRSYEEQNKLFTAQLESQRRQHPELSEAELITRTCKNVNFPGTSEFNTGLSFCLYLYAQGSGEIRSYYRTTPFYDTPDGQWLLENAWKYGFVFRFPVNGYPTSSSSDKSLKTGMSVPLNCYRYVGKAHAAAMHHLDLCLEEYIEYLMDHPHIAVYEDGVKRYEIIRREVGDAESFTLEGPEGGCSVSLDNLGGAVVAYEY